MVVVVSFAYTSNRVLILIIKPKSRNTYLELSEKKSRAFETEVLSVELTSLPTKLASRLDQ